MNRFKVPEYLLGKYQLIGTVTFSVLFALVFLNIYIPFSDTAWFGLGDSVMFLLTLSFAFMVILLLVVSRVLMYKSKSLFEMTYPSYIRDCHCQSDLYQTDRRYHCSCRGNLLGYFRTNPSVCKHSLGCSVHNLRHVLRHNRQEQDHPSSEL